MPAEVKILIPGYSNADSIAETGEEKTQPTVILIRDKGIVMVVDPGIMPSQQVLIDALKHENIGVEDVNYVCVTHSHLDHYRNVGMFPCAKVLEFFGIWKENTVEDWQEQFSPNIQIVRTPGHDYTDITLFVNTSEGVIGICGDVFWKEDYPHDSHDDAFASDPDKLEQSREMVIKMSDWIIPGHGPMFRVKKKQIAKEEYDKSPKNEREKITAICRKCHKQMNQADKCLCRPWLCYRCCECDMDCDLCSCSHINKSKF